MQNDTYKEKTKETYDLYAKDFDAKFGEHFNARVKDEADIFISYLAGNKILDIGSGPGNHAEYFKSKGFDVICGDISPAMVSLCAQKGLRAELIDIEEKTLPDTFHAVWAYAVLLHIPKNKIKKAVENILVMLKPGGLIGLALKEGEGEHMETHHSYPNTERLFTYFTDQEVRELFLPTFDLLHFNRMVDRIKYRHL